MTQQSTTKNITRLKSDHLGALRGEADLALGVYLLRYGFDGQAVSLGIVGQPEAASLLTYNALVGNSANVVCLVPGSTFGGSAAAAATLTAVVAEGYELRTHLSDLTVVGRWSKLLIAAATQPVGILDVDASWAMTETVFWANLKEMIQHSLVVVRIKGLLNSAAANTALKFLRSMPADSGLEFLAASPDSIWFATTASAERLRELLVSSGFFRLEADGTIQARDGALLESISPEGALPRVGMGLSSNAIATAPVEFISGWNPPEDDGCWTGAKECVLAVTVPDAKERIAGLAVTGNAWCAPRTGEQVLEFGVGRKPSTWKEFKLREDSIQSIYIDVPPNETGRSLLLTVRVQNPGRPTDFGGEDSRLLGFKARNLVLYTRPATKVAAVP